MEKRILVVGKGHLGKTLVDRWKVPPEMHWTTDAMNITVDDIVRLAPEVIVNAAGKTDLKWCEDNTTECFRCNVRMPIHLYRAVKDSRLYTLFIHLSSGCVWDGPYRPDGKPFMPTDRPTPACFYSWTKAACDSMLMDEAASPIAILRPRQVYSGSGSPRDTLTKLNSYKKLLDTPNSMTSASTIIKTIEALVALGERPEPGYLGLNGVMNVYDAGVTTPYRVGVMLAEAGCREMPERLEKSDLDTWHSPKRVDAVISDPWFEELVNPSPVEDELSKAILKFSSNQPYIGTKWRLMRQDDTGNTFVVEENLERDDAVAKQRVFEERGHKQLYYLAKM
jgi:dTDP-4-dehydrorhamnose reductase